VSHVGDLVFLRVCVLCATLDRNVWVVIDNVKVLEISTSNHLLPATVFSSPL
jgi:hypothetical protein